MNGKIEKANGDSAVEVMKVLELASKSLIKELKRGKMLEKKNFSFMNQVILMKM